MYAHVKTATILLLWLIIPLAWIQLLKTPTLNHAMTY